MTLSLLVGILAIVTAERTNIIAGEGGGTTKYQVQIRKCGDPGNAMRAGCLNQPSGDVHESAGRPQCHLLD